MMRIRRKNCLGKIAIVISSTVLISLLLWGNSSQTEYNTNGGSGPLNFAFPNRLWNTMMNSSHIVSSRVQKCVSSISSINITANYTLNNILDRVRIAFRDGHIEAVEDTVAARGPDVYTADKTLIPDSEPLEIIVIPHSHNDPGWKKTYQKYFDDQTTHILSKIVEKLHQYPDMTFIWVESCFLDKWWANQTLETREMFRSLVQSGRLEITSGMWVAPDEASPHYFALLDQMIEGHYWVKRNLGIVPESSLNFDQFGYSATMPYFAKKAGLKNVLIKRIHRGLKELFGKQQNLNFHWRQFWDPEGKNDVFGHVDTYEWMSISDSCGPDRSVCRGLDFLNMADLPVPGSSAAQRPFRSDHLSNQMALNLHDFTQKLIQQFRLKTANYKYKVMMLPHGGDFRYVTDYEWEKQYKNMKVFMQYVNENKKMFNVHMRFGTLKDYFNEVRRQEQKYGLTYPVVSGDFYTYTEGTDYWTGYFTTRQFDKRLGREVLESLRAAELFTAVAFQDPSFEDDGPKKRILSYLESARKNLGVFQHHDAITGTSQAHVVIDYEKLLTSAFSSTQKALSLVTEYLLSSGPKSLPIEGKVIPVLKRTEYNTLTKRVTVPIISSGTKIILVNSFTQSRREIVTLNVQTFDVVLLDQNGNEVDLDFVSVSERTVEIKFEVNFPPLSILVYTLKPPSGQFSVNDVKQRINVEKHDGNYFCENDFMNVTFYKETGSPKLICYKSSDFCTQVVLDWRYYRGSGGAYTMISQGVEETAFQSSPKVTFLKGKTFCGVKSQNGYFSFKISLPLAHSITGRALRVDVLSDLSRARNFIGDLAMRIETPIRSKDIYYVDSNGFQLMGRKFRNNLPFDGNVYPMSAMSILEDDTMRLVVHSAQSHGVVSRASGKIDFMLDRIATRPEMDLPEGVSDNKPTKTILYLQFETTGEFEKSTSTETTLPSMNSLFLNDVIQHPIYKFFSLDNLDIPHSSQNFLNEKLSCDFIIANLKNLVDMTSRPDGTSITLFRRAVSCGKNITNDFCELYEQVKLKPSSLFRHKFSKVTEMSLSHLITIQDLREDDVVTFEPMDLKTFYLS